MINKTIDIDCISFTKVEVPENLLNSIAKRGIAIPVKVAVKENQYQCVDGNQRLSACQILLQTNEKFRRIPVMITNDFSKAGSSFWGNTQNHH